MTAVQSDFLPVDCRKERLGTLRREERKSQIQGESEQKSKLS